MSLASAIRIPDTPRDLLALAAAMSRVRAQWEAAGGTWFTLEDELAYRDGGQREPSSG